MRGVVISPEPDFPPNYDPQKILLYLGEINDSDRAAWTRAIEAVDEGEQTRQIHLFPDHIRRFWRVILGGAFVLGLPGTQIPMKKKPCARHWYKQEYK